MSVVNYEVVENIGVIRLNNPPVNALSPALREGIIETLKIANEDSTDALILICEGRTFIAGADISEFGKPPKDPSLPEVMTALETSKKLIIAAIHGTALGGGFEIALACHYRCALASAKVGLPEVKLGLLPGAGGTQRTPRLAGAEAALELITSGNPIAAVKAEEIKLLDRIIESDDLLAGALNFAGELVISKAPTKRVRDIEIESSSDLDSLFASYRKKLAKRARGQIAPQRIVDCVEAAVNLPMDQGLAKERELFMECRASSQSSAMRHMFFAEREAAKVLGLPKDTPLRDINKVAIIGGGTMGGGIAMNFANVGIPVTLLEINEEALERGLGIVQKNYDISVSKGKLSETRKAECLSLIDGTTSYDNLADVDLVIEAVFEDLNIKREVFSKLDEVCKPGAILATNTSYQDINLIAEVTKRPQDVIGMHFFSPANVMKLLEVVRTDTTADDVIATTMKLAKKIKKVPVIARVCYGFIGNRMLGKYVRETQLCLIEGASPEQIDKVMYDWGMAMGPLSVGDLAGLDIGYKARQALTDEQRGDPKSYCIPDALVEMGRLGQKTGAGYYKYDSETRAKSSDPQVMEIVEQQAKSHDITRCEISDEEILERLTFALINEGAKILEEGIAQRSGDIDATYVFGYGFPRHRGGPLHYADTLGIKHVYDSICKLCEQHGDTNWKPSELLKELANSGGKFGQ